MKNLFFPLFLIFVFIQTSAQKTIIHCGKLIDGKSNSVIPESTITVEGNKIIAIEKGFKLPGQNDKLIDL